MTAAVLAACFLTLAWAARVLAAAGREQIDILVARAVSPDEVCADAAEFTAALDVLLAGER